MSSYENTSAVHPAEEEFDGADGADVNKTDFVDEQGVVDFDKLQEMWQDNQPAMQNGLQQVEIYHKGGNTPIYFKGRMGLVVDLFEHWHEVRQAVIKGEAPREPVWFAITGAFCSCVDLREVIGIQARPAGNYRSNDARRRGGPPRRGGYQGGNGGGGGYQGGNGHGGNRY
jgi:hypothetical protein